MRVAETTYIHLSTYDDSLRTDNDDTRCGKLLRYKVPGEEHVSPVGDGSPISVPEMSLKVEDTKADIPKEVPPMSLNSVGTNGTAGG